MGMRCMDSHNYATLCRKQVLISRLTVAALYCGPAPGARGRVRSASVAPGAREAPTPETGAPNVAANAPPAPPAPVCRWTLRCADSGRDDALAKDPQGGSTRAAPRESVCGLRGPSLHCFR